jgi:hypothetical protein
LTKSIYDKLIHLLFPSVYITSLRSFELWAIVINPIIGVVYLATLASSESKQRLEQALRSLLDVTDQSAPICLYQLYFEHTLSERTPLSEKLGSVTKFSFPSPSLCLSFNDADLDAVKEAWKVVMGSETPDAEYLVFEDREGANAHDDVYD